MIERKQQENEYKSFRIAFEKLRLLKKKIIVISEIKEDFRGSQTIQEYNFKIYAKFPQSFSQ